MSDPTTTVLSRLRERGHEPRESGNGWEARCPAHEDRQASLSIGTGADGRALGEISSLRYDPDRTEVVACPYADGRRGLPMNLSALRQLTGHWPAILAADVLCYFGALDEVLTAVHARLEPGGWFVFSLERLVADHDGEIPGNGSWALLRQGRYAHAVEYAHNCATEAGFAIRLLTPEVVRYEAGVPVDGIMMVLERTRHDG